MSNKKLITPRILKGFRDFLPEEALKRQYAIDIIRRTFELYGFEPLETPALEYADTLLGKYGDEADKLLYVFEDRGKRKVGLRYDQTVPLARVISQYPELPKPFKRYQIQSVWRAENTQKGRYREFLQCDADIIGDNFSPTADAEILSLIWSIYNKLGFKSFKLVVNSRTLLKTKINQAFGNPSKIIDDQIFLKITRILDKKDKIGVDGVKTELIKNGYPYNNIINLLQSLKNKSYRDLENEDRNLFYSLQMAIENFKVPEESLTIDPFMSRGLDYYTGLIVEGSDNNYKSSLVGGGRYDQLIGKFIGNNIPAVGFAIGFDRTLEAMELLNLMPNQSTYTQVLICMIEDWDKVFPTALNLTSTLRSKKINTEMYLNPQEKIDKQLQYANKKGIPYVIIIGPDEAAKNLVTLKNMTTGKQETLTLEKAINVLAA
jgi:histidyl-tRNA synthetase